MASPFFGIAVINSLLFGVYGWALDKTSINGNTNISGYLFHFNFRVFFAGAFSGLINSFLSCPIELLKIRLQNQTTEKLYNGNIDLMKKIWKNHGWKGFYRGFGMTIIRETPSYAVYFASYEILTNSMDSDSSISLLTAGGLAGVCFSI
jgi:solute carrier family 25 carnitine/acylcarnitine transporter 20/29